jgi:hypothetical protein
MKCVLEVAAGPAQPDEIEIAERTAIYEGKSNIF